MWTRLKHENWILLNSSFMNHTFYVFVRIASARRSARLTNTQNVCFTEELHGNNNEKIYGPLIFVDPDH